MTKQRDIFKGRVKRLLKEQKDMGQVGEPAVQSCGAWISGLDVVVAEVAAIEAFVHDLGWKLKAQTDSRSESAAITPVELKQVVMAHPEFAFLQEKVASIDESDAKYHKTHAKKKKSTAAAAKTATKKRTAAAAASGAKEKKAAKKAPTRAKKATTTAVPAAADKSTVDLPPSAKKAQEIEIEEDDDYDESDSE